ncbi:MAG: hypothetical protein V7L29_28270 [Nostoc sp.]|uniref:hypothetical protein n=1 Tax=Nostoc sp. TaxID=1180 RepID=UPI002FF5197C
MFDLIGCYAPRTAQTLRCANCSPLALPQADALYETLRVASFPEGVRGLVGVAFRREEAALSAGTAAQRQFL